MLLLSDSLMDTQKTGQVLGSGDEYWTDKSVLLVQMAPYAPAWMLCGALLGHGDVLHRWRAVWA